MSTIKYERDGTLKAPNEIGLQDESGEGEQRSEPVRPEAIHALLLFLVAVKVFRPRINVCAERRKSAWTFSLGREGHSTNSLG